MDMEKFTTPAYPDGNVTLLVVEIERLNQRVKQLEALRVCADHDANELAKELAALKAGQGSPNLPLGEPFGWYWTLRNKDKAIIEDGIIVNDGDNYAVQLDWIPLYTSAPTKCVIESTTLPKGYVMVPVEPLHKLLEYAEESNSAQYGTLSTRLVRDLVEEALAAAPKPEE